MLRAHTVLLTALICCAVPALAAIQRRGLYVSIDTAYAANELTSLVLGNATREAALFEYCRTRGVNALSLYDLHRVIGSRDAALRSFVTRARVWGGVRWVEAIGATALWAWDQVAEYQAGCASEDERFDGIVTEIEYWAGGGTNVTEMLEPVMHLRRAGPVARRDPVDAARSRFYYAAYIGWPQAGQIAGAMARELDHVYLHVYRTSPSSSYSYARTRIAELLTSNLTAVIIYSSEGVAHRAMSESFMGDWLAASANNTVQSAEEAYLSQFGAEHPGSANASRLWGFQWFTYHYNTMYDNATSSRGPYDAAVGTSWPLVRKGAEWTNVAWCGRHAGAYTRCQNLSYVGLKHDAVFVDMFDTSAATIAGLKARRWTNGTSTASLPNRTVVCYYSSGTWEDWREDRGNFTSGALRGPMGSWPGEQWLDIFNATVMAQEIEPAMRWRLELAAAKGCDAVEPDNVDCWQNSACLLGHDVDAAKAAQLAYNLWTARTAHELGLAVGLKNDLEQVGQLVDAYDFAVNENCQQYSECGMLLPFLQRDKAVFRTEYTVSVAAACGAQEAWAHGPYYSTLVAVAGEWLDCASLAPAPTPTTTVSAGGTLTTPAPSTDGGTSAVPPTTTLQPSSGPNGRGDGAGGAGSLGALSNTTSSCSYACKSFYAFTAVAVAVVLATFAGVCVLVRRTGAPAGPSSV